jgi:hypothetical protein
MRASLVLIGCDSGDAMCCIAAAAADFLFVPGIVKMQRGVCVVDRALVRSFVPEDMPPTVNRLLDNSFHRRNGGSTYRSSSHPSRAENQDLRAG